MVILLLSIKGTSQFSLIMSLTFGRHYFTIIVTLKVFLKIINLYYLWETRQDNCHYMWKIFQDNRHFKSFSKDNKLVLHLGDFSRWSSILKLFLTIIEFVCSVWAIWMCTCTCQFFIQITIPYGMLLVALQKLTVQW
jgi:hypothetical protein